MGSSESFPSSFWAKSLEQRDLSIAVIGLGYVGLPTAVAFHDAGFDVKGYDKSIELIESLKSGKSIILEENGKKLPSDDKWAVSSNPRDCIKDSDVIIVCVPTPVNNRMNPDLSRVREALETIITHRDPERDNCIILESTVHPGSSRKCLEEALETTGGTSARLHLAYCPERISPGETGYGIGDVSRVLGAESIEIAEAISKLYRMITNSSIHVVSSIEVAEASKLVENAQRDIDLAFINELSILMPKMGLDVEEVLAAASTKWNFHRHTPGMGVGGHCIPIDPHYYIEIAKKYGVSSALSPAARRLNDSMPVHNVNEVIKLCGGVPTSVLILGYAYKPNISDTRETPVGPFIQHLSEMGVGEISVWDPLVSSAGIKEDVVRVDQLEKLQEYECIVLGTAHDEILNLNWGELMTITNANFFYDSRRCLDAEIMGAIGWKFHAIGMPLPEGI